LFYQHTINPRSRVSTISPKVIYNVMPMKIAQRWWNEENFGTKLSPNILMKLIKRENILIEHNIS
jgi:hypothetical protein